jgi:hypothetical protein
MDQKVDSLRITLILKGSSASEPLSITKQISAAENILNVTNLGIRYREEEITGLVVRSSVGIRISSLRL